MKKIILALGTLATIVTPIAVTVSCGASTKIKPHITKVTHTEFQAAIDLLNDNTKGWMIAPTISDDDDMIIFSEGTGDDQKITFKGKIGNVPCPANKYANWPKIIKNKEIILVISKNGYTINGNDINLQERTSESLNAGKQKMIDVWRTQQKIVSSHEKIMNKK